MSEASNVIDAFVGRRYQAQSQAAGHIDADPEEAARAIELGDATGVHPSIIDGNVKEFEQQHKAKLASDIIKNNPHIAEYVNSHPLAAKLSNDDYGRLDSVSEKMKKLGMKSAFQEGIDAFIEGYDPKGQQEEWRKTNDLVEHPVMSVLMKHPVVRGAAAALDVSTRAFTGALHAAGAMTGSFAEQATGSEAWGRRATRDAIQMGMVGLSGQAGWHGQVHPEVMKMFKEAAEVKKLGEPYISAGKEPPLGLHKWFDEIHKEQSKADLKNLDELFKEARKTATLPRNPDIFADNFVRPELSGNIGISGHAVEKLYGDTEPHAGDGKLGDIIPNLKAQLEEAKQTGGDVSVPLADWIAKAPEELVKELHDHIRVRRSGLTREEAKNFKPEYPKEEEVTLTQDTETPSIKPKGNERFYRFEIGDKAGEAIVEPQDGGKHLHVRWIGGGVEFEGSAGKTVGFIPNALGPTKIRALLEAVAKEFPDAETIGGDRGSGAREGASNDFPTDVKVKMPRDPVQHTVDDIRRVAGLEGPRMAPSTGLEKYLGGALDALPHDATIGGPPARFAGVEVQPLHSYPLRRGLQVASKDNLNQLQRSLMNLISERIEKLVGDTPIKILTQADINKIYEKSVEMFPDQPLPEGGVAGMYLHNTREIVIAEGVTRKPRLMAIVTLHEGVHAFTLEALYRSPKIEANVKALLKEADQFLKDVDPGARDVFNYAFVNEHEFMSEAFARPGFQEALAKIPLSEELATKIGLGKGKFNAWDAIRAMIKNLLEKVIGRSISNSMLDAVLHMGKEIEQFNKDFTVESKRQRERPQATGEGPLDMRDPFEKAAAGGMTKPQYEAYLGLIEKRQKEDLLAAHKRAEKEQRKRQTDEWKKNTVEERKQASEDISARPDIQADQFLRDKNLTTKIDPKTLTPEQRAYTPKEYLSKTGISADDLAPSFGYPTGDAMLAALAAHNAAVKESGLRPELYRRKLVDTETERRMQEKYGELKKNILDEAIDQALSEVQVDMLHEQVLAAATKAGAEFSLTKEQVRAGIRKMFEDKAISEVDTNKALADAAKAHRQANILNQEGKHLESFHEAQKGYYNTVIAQEATKLEKERDTFDRKAKTLGKPNDKISPEYSNALQLILDRIGKRTARDVEAIQRDLSKEGYDSFKEFIDDKEKVELQDLHVPEFFDETFRQQYDDLTVKEFRAIRDMVKAIEKAGRENQLVYHLGEAKEWAEVKADMIEALKDIGPARHYPIDRKMNTRAEQAKSWWWSAITIESMANRFDRGNPNGIFHKYVIYPFTSASNYKDRLLRQFQKKLDGVGEHFTREYMDKLVENNIWHDPITGDAFPMRKRNVLGILAYRGNASSWEKLTKGYGVEPDVAEAWLKRNTTKQDWDAMQKIGDVFGELFGMADEMSYKTSGVGIEKLALEPFTSPHGDEYPGWYNPVKYDSYRPGKSKKLLGGETESSAYFKATTPQGYTKKRTGYIAPVELNLDIIPVRMKQMIHDIAMRPALQQVSKVFRDTQFKGAVIAHYGRHQAEEMMSFLTDMAGAAQFKSFVEQLQGQSLEYYRQNLISSLIGFNPGTVMKHGTTALVNSMQQVGIVNWSREFATLMHGSEEAGKSNWRMAMDNSEELQRRMRNFVELIEGHGRELGLRATKTNFDSMREIHMAAGATPVSISDLLSAVPTWLAEYKKLVADGMDKGAAVEQADRAVRQAHGSSVLTNRPSFMRSNPLGAWFTALYGFFNHMQQKQYEIAWRYKDALGMWKGGDKIDALKAGVIPTRMLVGYLIIPALIEELVTPYAGSDKDSWGVKAAKTFGLGISSSFVGVRDFAHALVGGRGGEVGLASTAFQSLTSVARDLGKGKAAFSKDNAAKVVKDVIALNGLLNGMTNNQEGKVIEYLIRYFQGQEKPKGPWDVAVGLRYGHTEGHSRTLEEYLKHLKGH